MYFLKVFLFFTFLSFNIFPLFAQVKQTDDPLFEEVEFEPKPFKLVEKPLVKSVFFGGGSYYVDRSQTQELYHFLDSIPFIEQYHITLQSHTDSIGGYRYNQWLSNMRSEAVLERLIQRELDETMIEINDFGLQVPSFTNRTFMGRQGNRRVDVIIWPVAF